MVVAADDGPLSIFCLIEDDNHDDDDNHADDDNHDDDNDDDLYSLH